MEMIDICNLEEDPKVVAAAGVVEVVGAVEAVGVMPLEPATTHQGKARNKEKRKQWFPCTHIFFK